MHVFFASMSASFKVLQRNLDMSDALSFDGRLFLSALSMAGNKSVKSCILNNTTGSVPLIFSTKCLLWG
jgi:hypothetical protein